MKKNVNIFCFEILLNAERQVKEQSYAKQRAPLSSNTISGTILSGKPLAFTGRDKDFADLFRHVKLSMVEHHRCVNIDFFISVNAP